MSEKCYDIESGPTAPHRLCPSEPVLTLPLTSFSCATSVALSARSLSRCSTVLRSTLISCGWTSGVCVVGGVGASQESR
jgi:hypothetical protein